LEIEVGARHLRVGIVDVEGKRREADVCWTTGEAIAGTHLQHDEIDQKTTHPTVCGAVDASAGIALRHDGNDCSIKLLTASIAGRWKQSGREVKDCASAELDKQG
jgi:hypothetical protein